MAFHSRTGVPAGSAVAVATAFPTAASSALHRVVALTTVCLHGDVCAADKAAALEQALAAMDAAALDCGIQVTIDNVHAVHRGLAHS